MKTSIKILLAITFAATLSAQAAVLANWQNDAAVATDLAVAADSSDPNLSVSDLSRITAGSTGFPNVLAFTQNNGAINSLATAITGDEYFTVTLTPAESTTVSYSDLFLRYTVTANVQPGVVEFSLLSSLTGFTSSDAIDTVSQDLLVSGAINGTGTFDISGAAALQDSTTAVEFRLYVHNTGANPVTRVSIGRAFSTDGADDFTLNGTITVTSAPEPSSLALLGMGVAILMMKRKKSYTTQA